MDIHAMLNDLRTERQRLQTIIAELEALQADAPVKRRGRKFMSAEERQQVAQRMRRYWAKRHKVA